MFNHSIFVFHSNIPVILCGVFYSVLCIFSIVTGLIYMSGKRELNPLELPDKFVNKLKQNPEKLKSFVFKAGLLTFVVGIVQGISAYCLFKGHGVLCYCIALGFTIFSIGSVAMKLKGKINIFPIIKAIAYVLILIVLLLPSTRALFI